MCCESKWWGTIFGHGFIIGLLLLVFTIVSCMPSEPSVNRDESTKNQETRMITTTPTTVGASSTTVGTIITLIETPAITTMQPTSPTRSTPTSIPLMVISTATPTFSRVAAVLPTITPGKHAQLYAELMNNNGECELPCWWGFELGVTPIDTVEQFYTSLGAYISKRESSSFPDYSVMEALFVDTQIEEGVQTRHMFSVQDKIITEVEVQVRWKSNYQIEPLLQQWGQPAEIWMWTIPEVYEGSLPVSLRLYYPEHGVLFAYTVRGTEGEDGVKACFNTPGSVIMRLWDPSIWDPNRTKGLVERANESSELSLDRDFYPIEEVSNWSVEEFYHTLVDPNHAGCLETPSEIWPSP